MKVTQSDKRKDQVYIERKNGITILQHPDVEKIMQMEDKNKRNEELKKLEKSINLDDINWHINIPRRMYTMPLYDIVDHPLSWLL